MTRILFVGCKYDYDRTGKITGRGYSHDYTVWYESMRKFRPDAMEVVAYWYDEVLSARGRNVMNKDLLEFIEKTKPQFIIFAFGADEIKKSTLRKIAEKPGLTTIYIAGDDAWRFDSNSKIFAPYCDWVLTSYSKTIPKYRAIGCENVITYAGWANPDIFQRKDIAKDIDVGFVGTKTRARETIVGALRQTGINVAVRGKYWAEGELPKEEMANFISRTKIMLGLNGSSYYFGIRPIARLFLRRPRLGSRNPFYVPDIHHLSRNYREWQQKKIVQIKGRIFEIPACGTAQITEYAEDLDLYYKPGKEIILFDGLADLLDKIRYYLTHHLELEKIAKAGFERTMRDHTSEKRLTDMFSKIGII
ncbi:MAG: glycosyltransferase [Candidatus Liptonbacteria bacterium]